MVYSGLGHAPPRNTASLVATGLIVMVEFADFNRDEEECPMTEDRLLIEELAAKGGQPDFLRTIAENMLQLIMEAHVDGLIGAGRHERSGDRATWRNGYRDRSLDTRVGTLNLKIHKLWAILLERGTIFPVGRRKLELGIDALLADEDTTLSPRLHQLVGELRAEWRELDVRIEALNGEFVELARNDAAARRLTSIPGVGALNATALIAAVGDASSFAKARDLGAWLGLVPRQHTTGGKPRLLGISKRGNTYLRTLLIRGARAALPSLARSETPLGRWLTGMIERGVHRNAIVVALANKLARIAWAALRKDAAFERGYPVAA
jgi:transposase